jgi:hypothetical protein
MCISRTVLFCLLLALAAVQDNTSSHSETFLEAICRNCSQVETVALCQLCGGEAVMLVPGEGEREGEAGYFWIYVGLVVACLLEFGCYYMTRFFLIVKIISMLGWGWMKARQDRRQLKKAGKSRPVEQSLGAG